MKTNIHADIPVTKCFIKESFLFNGNKTKTAWIPCKIYAISSYIGNVPTFKILLDNGSLFDYIPIHALTTSPENVLEQYSLSDLCYFNCKDDEIVVNVHKALTNKVINCYLKHKNVWESGAYICTIDWFRDNENCHLVSLTNGQFVLIPNHKCVVGAKASKVLNPYEKIEDKWIL